jgi:hypothetical protein
LAFEKHLIVELARIVWMQIPVVGDRRIEAATDKPPPERARLDARTAQIITTSQ